MLMRAMNQEEQQALERLIVYIRDDCGEWKDYQAMMESGEDTSQHIWRQVRPLILYLLQFEKRDCEGCGKFAYLTKCKRCKKKCCAICLRFVEWLRGRPYLCRRCHNKAIDES